GAEFLDAGMQRLAVDRFQVLIFRHCRWSPCELTFGWIPAFCRGTCSRLLVAAAPSFPAAAPLGRHAGKAKARAAYRLNAAILRGTVGTRTAGFAQPRCSVPATPQACRRSPALLWHPLFFTRLSAISARETTW